MKYRPPPKETILYVDPQQYDWDGPGIFCLASGWVLFGHTYPAGYGPKYPGETGAYFSKAGGHPDLDAQGEIVGFDAIKRIVRKKTGVKA